MKKLFLLPILFLILISGCNYSNPNNPRPNIVLIMADDMGYSDLGCFGSGISTPNLDQLAGNGLIMTQFYNTGRCCPSRASLLTGVYQHQAGIGDMTADRGLPSYQGFLNHRVVTLAEVLKMSGYHTLMTGKWHVGGRKEHWPLNRGFERFFGFPRGGGVYFYPFRSGREAILDSIPLEVDPDNFYSTDAINDYAVRFLDEIRDSDQPFFLYVAHIAPHFPLQAWPEDIARYRGSFMEGFETHRRRRYQFMRDRGLVDERYDLSPTDDRVLNWGNLTLTQKDSFDLRMAIYAAQIDRMDQGLKRIFDKIKEMNEWENTLILFLSDNGGCHEDPSRWLDDTGPLGGRGCQQAYTPSWANVSNTPFRMYKHWVHEGGIASPLIAHYPGVIQPGRIDDQMAHIMDLMPTCIDLAQGSYPENFKDHRILPMEGKSLVPVFSGEVRSDYPDLFWEHEGNRAVRSGPWKLVSKYPENIWELYNMDHDRSEINDLSIEYPKKVTEMIGKYEAWADRAGVVEWNSLLSRQD